MGIVFKHLSQLICLYNKLLTLFLLKYTECYFALCIKKKRKKAKQQDLMLQCKCCNSFSIHNLNQFISIHTERLTLLLAKHCEFCLPYVEQQRRKYNRT